MSPARYARLALAMLAVVGCDEGLPDVPLELSKNCSEAGLEVLAPRVGSGPGEAVLDVAADGALGETAWVLLRRSTAEGNILVVQRVSASGVQHEVELPFPPGSSLSLSSAPEVGRVWLLREEPGLFEV